MPVLAGEIAQRHDNRSSGRGSISPSGVRQARASGAFLVQGMQVRLEGEANDYVGKGMNSGCITLLPSRHVARNSPGDQVILGNTYLYRGHRR